MARYPKFWEVWFSGKIVVEHIKSHVIQKTVNVNSQEKTIQLLVRQKGTGIMARATTCHLDDRLINVAVAIDQRDLAREQGRESPYFRCRECGRPVRPHKESGYGAAHFEHLERNPNCPLSDPAR